MLHQICFFFVSYLTYRTGIISSLAFCPSYSSEECFYAAGTFSSTSNNIAIFSDVGSEPVMFIGGGPQEGVTQVWKQAHWHFLFLVFSFCLYFQLQFNPAKPNILYAAYRGRGVGSIYSWDVRSDVHVPLEIFRIPTTGDLLRTNQKIRFDIDPTGRFLSIGDQVNQFSIRLSFLCINEVLQSGFVSLFKLDTGLPDLGEHQLENCLREDSSVNTNPTNPCIYFKAHQGNNDIYRFKDSRANVTGTLDTVGSVAFHPFSSRLLSASGSRHFVEPYQDSSDSEDDMDQINASKREGKRSQPVTFDSSLKIWGF